MRKISMQEVPQMFFQNVGPEIKTCWAHLIKAYRFEIYAGNVTLFVASAKIFILLPLLPEHAKTCWNWTVPANVLKFTEYFGIAYCNVKGTPTKVAGTTRKDPVKDYVQMGLELVLNVIDIKEKKVDVIGVVSRRKVWMPLYELGSSTILYRN